MFVWTGLTLVTFLGLQKQKKHLSWLEFAQVTVVTFVVVVVIQVLLGSI